MTDAETNALKAVDRFLETFNAQDKENHALSLNYPHVRLANGRFARIETADEFRSFHDRTHERLMEEGWHHTVLSASAVIHSGEDKVHLALTMDRCHEDGTVYNQFDTFWIATLVDGQWGIQFRSSFLR